MKQRLTKKSEGIMVFNIYDNKYELGLQNDIF